MTVAQLMELLSHLDPDAQVWVSQNGGEYVGDLSGEIEVTDGRVTFMD